MPCATIIEINKKYFFKRGIEEQFRKNPGIQSGSGQHTSRGDHEVCPESAGSAREAQRGPPEFSSLPFVDWHSEPVPLPAAASPSPLTYEQWLNLLLTSLLLSLPLPYHPSLSLVLGPPNLT